jgi:transposase-like protein
MTMSMQFSLSDEIIQQLISDDEEGLAKLKETVFNQLLEEQRTEQLQADPHERTEDRKGRRNGYYERDLTTRVGTIELTVPRIRNGEFSTEIFQRYQRSEKALVLSLLEMVVNGVSTRKVKTITKKLCGESVSKSTVSRLCESLDPVVEDWNQRSLEDHEYPVIMLDGFVTKIRHENRVVSKSLMIGIGFREDGYREILGVQVGHSETYEGWKRFVKGLKDRGLHGVDAVISDDHSGLRKAVTEQFQGTIWQRCQTHFMRNVLDECPKRHRDALHSQLKDALQAPNKEEARRRKEQLMDDFEGKAPKALRILDEGFEDAIAVLCMPKKYQKKFRTTNMIERLNEELRRRERVIRIFPNEHSALRLAGAVLMEIHEDWITGVRCPRMEKYHEWKEAIENEKQESSSEVKAA